MSEKEGESEQQGKIKRCRRTKEELNSDSCLLYTPSEWFGFSEIGNLWETENNSGVYVLVRGKQGHKSKGISYKSMDNRSTPDVELNRLPPKSHSEEMEPNVSRDSTLFPAGYGDFALESSDRITCHFPRYILGYMSQFFEGMFNLPAKEGQDQSNESQEPLKVTEPVDILELFLVHVDPKKQIPLIDPVTIIALLEAARKYQVTAIMEWFTNEALTRHEVKKIRQIDVKESLMTAHPLLVLQCATQFDFPELGCMAFAEATRCPTSSLNTAKLSLDPAIYALVLALRQSQSELYSSLIDGLLVSGTSYDICRVCGRQVAQWLLRMERAARDEPTWDAFMKAYESMSTYEKARTCQCSKVVWTVYCRYLVNERMATILAKERALPDWPLLIK